MILKSKFVKLFCCFKHFLTPFPVDVSRFPSWNIHLNEFLWMPLQQSWKVKIPKTFQLPTTDRTASVTTKLSDTVTAVVTDSASVLRELPDLCVFVTRDGKVMSRYWETFVLKSE